MGKLTLKAPTVKVPAKISIKSPGRRYGIIDRIKSSIRVLLPKFIQRRITFLGTFAQKPFIVASLKPKVGLKRPNFSLIKQDASRLEATLSTDIDYSKANLSAADLAAPHRAPYSKLRDLIFNSDVRTVENALGELINASITYEDAFKRVTLDPRYNKLGGYYESTRKDLESKLTAYLNGPTEALKQDLVIAANNLASNAPGLGPHSTANLPVSDRLHLHPVDEPLEPLTPRSKAAFTAFGKVTPVATAAGMLVSATGDRSTSTPSFITLAHEVGGSGAAIRRGALRVDGGKVYKPSGLSGWERVS
jgi:hypothetical protein